MHGYIIVPVNVCCTLLISFESLNWRVIRLKVTNAQRQQIVTRRELHNILNVRYIIKYYNFNTPYFILKLCTILLSFIC